MRNSLFSAGMTSNIFSPSYLRAISTLSTMPWSSPQGTWLPSFQWNRAGPLHWWNCADWTCLAGGSDYSIHISKTLTCQRVGNKSPEISGVFHISEIPSRMKNKLLHLSLLLLRKKGTTSRGPLWILEATYISFGKATLTHLLRDLKAPTFEWGPE